MTGRLSILAIFGFMLTAVVGCQSGSTQRTTGPQGPRSAAFAFNRPPASLPPVKIDKPGSYAGKACSPTKGDCRVTRSVYGAWDTTNAAQRGRGYVHFADLGGGLQTYTELTEGYTLCNLTKVRAPYAVNLRAEMKRLAATLGEPGPVEGKVARDGDGAGGRLTPEELFEGRPDFDELMDKYAIAAYFRHYPLIVTRTIVSGARGTKIAVMIDGRIIRVFLLTPGEKAYMTWKKGAKNHTLDEVDKHVEFTMSNETSSAKVESCSEKPNAGDKILNFLELAKRDATNQKVCP